MSTKSSFKAALERQGKAPARSPGGSDSQRIRVSLRARKIAQPVDVARLLVKLGLSLRKAHEILNRLALGETVPAEISSNDTRRTLADLETAGVLAQLIAVPVVDVRAVREKLDISQAEFAIRFGFELDTVQNWEQHRYAPDRSAQLLLKIIEKHPQLVEETLLEGGDKPR